MTIVADAGPVLHLFWVGASAWALPEQTIDVVDEVWREIESQAPEALNDARLRRVRNSTPPPPQLATYQLHPGESAALSHALASQSEEPVLVLCDEREARRACSDLGLSVVGSIGLIVEAFRAGRVSAQTAIAAIRDLPVQGRMHVRSQLIEAAVGGVEREARGSS